MQEAHGWTEVKKQIKGQEPTAPTHNFSHCSVLPSVSGGPVSARMPSRRSLAPRYLGSGPGSTASSKPGCLRFSSVKQGNLNT